MAKSLEDVLLIVSHVKNKKCEGSLYLMSERMAWMPSGKNQFTISYSYTDIKSQKISPDAKDKVQLQVVLNSSGANTFHFNNPGGRPTQINDRESVKELLQQMLSKFKRKMNSDLEEKNRMLQEDPDLFQLYKDLVVSGVLTADEFWANRIKTKAAMNDVSKQDIGVSAAFLADVQGQTDGCNGVRYNLTADIIESIFRTYPAVQKKHADFVPDRISEQEFWTQFFQSHYFHRDRINITDKELFADCAKKDEQSLKNETERPMDDPMLDLRLMFDSTLDEGYCNTSEDSRVGSIPANASLIRRFNQHSTMVLKSCDRNQQSNAAEIKSGTRTDINNINGDLHTSLPPGHSCSSLQSTSNSNKQARIKEKIEFTDLDEEVSEVSGPALKLARLDPYLHGPTPVMPMQYNTSDEMFEAAQALTHDVMAWKSSTQVLQSASALNVLWDLSPAGSLMQNLTTQQLNQIVPPDAQAEAKNLYSALSELLRHFWACFPATTKELEDKACRMHDCLKRFQNNKLHPFKTKLASYHFTVDMTNHMAMMLEKAFGKFSSWQAKKLSKRT